MGVAGRFKKIKKSNQDFPKCRSRTIRCASSALVAPRRFLGRATSRITCVRSTARCAGPMERPGETCGSLFAESLSGATRINQLTSLTTSINDSVHCRRYACSVCGKRFRHRGHRNDHVLTHVGGRKPFRCCGCGNCAWHQTTVGSVARVATAIFKQVTDTSRHRHHNHLYTHLSRFCSG